MEGGSPILLGFPLDGASEQRESGADMRVDSTSAHPRQRALTQPQRTALQTAPLSEKRSQRQASLTSLGSGVDKDLLNQWSPTQDESNTRHNSSTSLNQRSVEDQRDEKDNDKLPSWSELKTKAGKERKRLPLACIACRRKKIKCSGEKPACKHCIKARIPCVYKAATRKAAPRTDYMAMLDKRLKRMEDRVIKVLPQDELPDFNVTGRSSVRPPLPGHDPKKEKQATTGKRSAEEAFDAELNEWTKSRKPTNILDHSARVRSQREGEKRLLHEGEDALPHQQLQEHLAEVFFDCVYGQSYLLLHKPSFMRKLKAGAVPPVLVLAVCAISARFSTHPQLNTEPAFLRGEQWATPARNIVEKRHFEPSITVLTVMLILGLHYFGTCEGGLSWSFGGQAMRMGYALQLHRELDHDPLGRAQAERAAASGKPVPQIPELSFTDREIRRRTMWACYLMDTFNSSGTERPSFLSEDYFSIQLPVKEMHFQLEIPGQTEDFEGHVESGSANLDLEVLAWEAKENMGVAAYVVRAVIVWKRIVKYLNLGGKEKDSHPMWDPLSEFASLQRQVSKARSSLPASLVYSPENVAAHASERLANQFIFLHIILAQINLFLHRFAIPTAPNTHRPYPPDTPRSFLTASAKAVLESSARISQLLADSCGHTLTVPFAGYCAYVSATVHVWGMFSRDPALEAASRDSLRHNYRYLTRMKRYWGMFHYMAESVKDLYRAFVDAKQRVTQKAPPNLASTDPTESGAISAHGSRSASPSSPLNAVGTTNLPDRSRSAGAESTLSAGNKSSAGKSMLQYGDWFDKYPDGVSDTEWEKKHLPHRSEVQKGTEAVMSQQSELRSVEEFFASLSPPSKEDRPGSLSQKGRRVARRRVKSVVDDKAGKAREPTQDNPKEHSRPRKGSEVRTASHPHPSSLPQPPSQPPSQSQPPPQSHFQSGQMQHLSSSNNPSQTEALRLRTDSDIDIPMPNVAAGLQSQQGNSAFDVNNSPAVYRSPHLQQHQHPTRFGSGSGPTSVPSGMQPATNSPFDYTTPTSTTASHHGGGNGSTPYNFNFNYTSALPHLDRQLVFGGYAGFGPSTSGNVNVLNDPSGFEFWSNPWQPIDVDGFAGFGDSAGMGGTTSQLQNRSQNGNEAGFVNSNSATANNLDAIRQPGSFGTHQMLQHQQQQQQRQNQQPIQRGISSSAWFMPFNIEPPNFGTTMDNYSGFDTMDAMDFGFDGEEPGPTSTGPGANSNYSRPGGPSPERSRTSNHNTADPDVY